MTDSIVRATAALRAGELIVFPTETFYAIGADPIQAKALDHLLKVKGRDPDKPIALIAASKDAALSVAREIPAQARLLAEKFWPGPLTLVLPARAGLSESLVGPSGGVGVRVSSEPIATQLAAAIGGLITATSANLSGQPPARTLAQARQSLGESVSVYIDGGFLGASAPSTVVEFAQDGAWHILRPGAVGENEIAAALQISR
jgi:L-threonylcarbamoyladenylate synthase